MTARRHGVGRCARCAWVLVIWLLGMGGVSTGADVEARDIIELPPLIVESSSDLPWFYRGERVSGGPRYEVLTQLDQATTSLFLVKYASCHRLLSRLVPESFRGKTDLPERLVLFDENTRSRSARELREKLDAVGGRGRGIRLAPNMALHDTDGWVFFAVLPPLPQGPERGVDLQSERIYDAVVRFTPAHVEGMLELAVPRPPEWFVEGFVYLYDHVSVEPQDGPLSGLFLTRVEPLIWVSAAETKKIKQHADRAPFLLPLRELFRRGPADERAEQKALRRSEAALLIRWCLEPQHAARRQALWTFVAAAAKGTADEATFRAAFGLTEAEALEALADYLPKAVRIRIEIPAEVAPRRRPPPMPPPSSAQPPPRQRVATPEEIARIKGDLQRLEINFVAAHAPELVSNYIEIARHTLMTAFDAGDREPDLLALIGLLECGAGNDRAARPFLEAAVSGAVARPRAYVELGRILLADAAASGRLGALDDATAGRIMSVLNAGRAQSPAQVQTYRLMCSCLAARAGELGAGDVEIINEGLSRFPHAPRLACAAAIALARHGLLEQAREVVARAMADDVSAADRRTLEQVAAAVAGPGR